MKRLRIAPHGPECSRLAYGTWRVLKTPCTAQELNARLQACLEHGADVVVIAQKRQPQPHAVKAPGVLF